MCIHASARIVSTDSARLGSRVSRGLEPVCNKINRGVARERTRGEASGAARAREEREALRGWFGRRRRDADRWEGGGPGEGRQNHPAGYSHPLDEATDCDGVPPPPPLLFSSSAYGLLHPPSA